MVFVCLIKLILCQLIFYSNEHSTIPRKNCHRKSFHLLQSPDCLHALFFLPVNFFQFSFSMCDSLDLFFSSPTFLIRKNLYCWYMLRHSKHMQIFNKFFFLHGLQHCVSLDMCLIREKKTAALFPSFTTRNFTWAMFVVWSMESTVIANEYWLISFCRVC